MMTPSKTIAPPGWMTAPESRAIFDALQDLEAEPQILFVGGCVRNQLLGVPVRDADLATAHRPEEVVRRLDKAGIKTVPTGIDHGTVTAVVQGKPFEITTLRKDIETDGRRAVVAFTVDWVEDAKRRDFTMNTLLADLQGSIYDPLRRGIKDLEEKQVIFVGDAAGRIAEDYLRILRFFRFHALYGEGAPDEEALSACRAAADRIPSLSRERITQEFVQIIACDRAGEMLGLMFDNKVLPEIVHPGFQLSSFNALTGMQKRAGLVSVPARLAALCAGQAEHLAMMGKYLIFSRVLAKTLQTLLGAVHAPMGIKERLYRFGREAGAQSVLLLAAEQGAKIGEEDLALLKDWDIPLYPLNGKDLSALGMAQGQEMGRILDAVEEWWIEWDFQPGHEDCLERAKDLLLSSPA